MTETVHVSFDAFILDCDGVIFDTNRAKVEAFRDTALAAGVSSDIALRFCRWQEQNFGTSRFRSFALLLAGEFGPVPEGLSLDVLVNDFANRVDHVYARAPETPMLRYFLQTVKEGAVFVASGSEEKQLRRALRVRGLESFFDGIFGSPTPKTDIVSGICSRISGQRDRVVMVGDAHADADAARSAGISFVFMRPFSTARESMELRSEREGIPVIDALDELLSLTPRTFRHAETV